VIPRAVAKIAWLTTNELDSDVRFARCATPNAKPLMITASAVAVRASWIRSRTASSAVSSTALKTSSSVTGTTMLSMRIEAPPYGVPPFAATMSAVMTAATAAVPDTSRRCCRTSPDRKPNARGRATTTRPPTRSSQLENTKPLPIGSWTLTAPFTRSKYG
jgi:hypothetical protein